MPKQLTDEELKEVAEELGVTVEYARKLHDAAIAMGVFGTGYKEQGDMRQFALKETTGIADITTRVNRMKAGGIAGGVPNGRYTKAGRKARSDGRVTSEAAGLVAKVKRMDGMAGPQKLKEIQELAAEYGLENVVKAMQAEGISFEAEQVKEQPLDQVTQEFSQVVEQLAHKEQPTSLGAAFKEFLDAKKKQQPELITLLTQMKEQLEAQADPGKQVYDSFTSTKVKEHRQIEENASKKQQQNHPGYDMFTSTKIGQKGQEQQVALKEQQEQQAVQLLAELEALKPGAAQAALAEAHKQIAHSQFTSKHIGQRRHNNS